MSIEYRSIVFKGWVVSAEEVSHLESEDDYEYLLNQGILKPQNSWIGDNSSYAYILCGTYIEADEDQIIPIDEKNLPAPEDAPASVEQFYSLFPSRREEKPQLMLMMEVF